MLIYANTGTKATVDSLHKKFIYTADRAKHASILCRGAFPIPFKFSFIYAQTHTNSHQQLSKYHFMWDMHLQLWLPFTISPIASSSSSTCVATILVTLYHIPHRIIIIYMCSYNSGDPLPYSPSHQCHLISRIK